MGLKVTGLELDGVILVEPEIFPDARGKFFELYHREKYSKAGIEAGFVQDNYSQSKKNVLRGLHFQVAHPQAKLVTALEGEIFDVVVDLRRKSASFKKWLGVRLSGEKKQQIFVPEGFAHGFCVLSESAQVQYKCSRLYDPADEQGLLWSDPEIGIAWPIPDPLLSPKDRQNLKLSEILAKGFVA